MYRREDFAPALLRRKADRQHRLAVLAFEAGEATIRQPATGGILGMDVEQRLALVRRRLELELGLPGPPLAPGVPGSRGIARGPGPEGGPSPAIPRKQARKALRAAPAPQDLEEERRYRLLLEREREIVEQWNRAAARGPKANGEENAGSERAKLRSELERVLREILDLRERARERQVERLRREIEDIERALDMREDEKERERLVNSRLRELLEGGARRP